jgi:putative phage-type endonuclease
MPTGSKVADIMPLKSGKYSTSRHKYMMELVAEKITGRSVDNYVSPAMEWGIEQEPFARQAYESAYGVMVNDVGFNIHPSIPLFGATPDGIVGEDGLIEIKCPTSRVHAEYLEGRVIPEDYIPQMNAELACTGRQWCDFISFDPRASHDYQLFVRRHERDQQRIAEMEEEVLKFLEEFTAKLRRIAESKPLLRTFKEAAELSIAKVAR